jgi:hypothetical protein
MRRDAILLFGAILGLSACGPKAEQDKPAANEASATNESRPARSNIASASTDNRGSPVESSGTIDPKSADAAAQVVQSYGALVEQGRWSEANALWGDPASAAKFQSQLAQFADVHLEMGNPGDSEGAAGSIYVTVPAICYGDARDGQPFRRSGDVILRRVNDVPGSTEAQRRWHIERIDWAG